MKRSGSFIFTLIKLYDHDLDLTQSLPIKDQYQEMMWF